MAAFGDVLRNLGSVLNPQVERELGAEDLQRNQLAQQVGLFQLQQQAANDRMTREQQFASAETNKKLAAQYQLHQADLKQRAADKLEQIAAAAAEGRITRQEADARAKATREEFQNALFAHQKEMANLVAGLRPGPQPQIVDTPTGLLSVKGGVASPVTLAGTNEPVKGKAADQSGKASEAIVDAVVGGRMPLPSGFALKSPYWQDVIDRVARKDPTFDATKYGARAAARRTFASGPEARNVTALNTVIGHLGTLDEAATALDNQDVRAFNAVTNRLATETGDPRVQNFDTAKQAVAEETMRVFRQVGASEIEAKQWGERITASGSPKQLRGVIGTLGKLLESRVEAIGQQYERTVNGTGNPAVVDPNNKASLGRLIEQGSSPSWNADKERRYQELLRKRNGGS